MEGLVACYLMVDGTFIPTQMPEEMVGQLAVKLREDGFTNVHLATRSVVAEGMYVPARGSKTKLVAVSE